MYGRGMNPVPPGFRRVLAVEGHCVPMRSADGTLHMERFIGYAPGGVRLTEPVDVPDGPDVWAALDSGALTEFAPPAAPAAPTAKRKAAADNGGS